MNLIAIPISGVIVKSWWCSQGSVLCQSYPVAGRLFYLYKSFLDQHDVPDLDLLPVAERQAAVRARVDALDVDLDAAQRAQRP